MQLGRRRPAVGTHDVRSFRGAAGRTAVLRVAIAGAALLLLGGAVATARTLDPHDRGLLPSGTTGVVVLDLSLSILDDRSGIVRRTLRQLVDADASIGLVIFSDVPYELLPPGTPARELEPVIRLLTPTGEGEVVTPWTESFRAGTKISAALELARDMLRGDRVENGSILLVSDLETAPDDVAATAGILNTLKSDGTPVRLLALAPSSNARALFAGVLGTEAFTPISEGPVRSPEPPEAASRPLPRLLLALGALLLLALAAHERYAGRLALPGAGRTA